jgi:hypothetical protein
MMTRKRIVIGITSLVILVLAILAFITWYKIHYSMDVAESFEVNSPQLSRRVLIATQGSQFKNAIVAALIDHLKKKNAYIKVIDVSTLPKVDEDKWTAIVVIHTWENMKPPAYVKDFVGRVKNLSKVIVLATSGRGNFKIEGINAISSASVMANVPAIASEIDGRLDSIFKSNAKQ